MEKDITHITAIEVKGLWGEINIKWKLNRDVNILIGKNGSGKTTLLNLIDILINEDNFNDVYFKFFKIYFNNTNYIELNFILENSAEEYFTKENMLILRKKYTAFSIKKVVENSLISIIGTNINLTATTRFLSIINISKVSTFELSLKDLKATEDKKDSNIKTELDMLLMNLIDDFKGYQLKLRNLEKEATATLDDKIKQLSLKETASKEELEEIRNLLKDKEKKISEIYKQKETFTTYIDKLFADSNKSMGLDKDNSIIFYKKNKIIKPYQLSSGEKQLLIILLTVILQENRPFILLMDEPEVSLHLSWQLDLIEIIQKLNTNCQLIIVTHSPGLFTKGWKDKVFEIENLITDHSDE